MLVIRDDKGPVARLTLNAPDKLNPLSRALLGELGRALAAIAEDPDIRAVVIAANGRAFSAGHDLNELRAARAAADGGRQGLKELFDACTGVMLAISDLPQPVIAEVQGLAAAAGCQLVASCDLALAADTARFGVNGVNVGLFCSTPMVALSRNVPRKAAFEMLVTGRLIPADEAVRIGLVNRAVPAEALRDESMALASTIAGKLGLALRIGKRAFYRQLELGLDEAYEYAGAVMVENMQIDETAEGIAAFVEKRPPRWGG